MAMFAEFYKKMGYWPTYCLLNFYLNVIKVTPDFSYCFHVVFVEERVKRFLD